MDNNLPNSANESSITSGSTLTSRSDQNDREKNIQNMINDAPKATNISKENKFPNTIDSSSSITAVTDSTINLSNNLHSFSNYQESSNTQNIVNPLVKFTTKNSKIIGSSKDDIVNNCSPGKNAAKMNIRENLSESSSCVSDTFSSSSSEKSITRSPLWRSYRTCIVNILMMCLFCTTSLRMNLGMAIVCMVNSTAFTDHNAEIGEALLQENGTGSIKQMSLILEDSKNLPAIYVPSSEPKNVRYSRCSASYQSDDGTKDYHGTLLWNPAMQSQLFSAVAYGSFVTVFLSGLLADRFGPKLLLSMALANSVLISFISPWLATTSYALFFIGRFIMGLGEGFIYPSLATAAARWFPPDERSRMAAYYTIGNQMASVVGFLVSSRLCSLSFLGGWPLIFYSFGIVGLLVLICWLLFATDGPQGNKWISDRERRYIITNTSSQFLPDNASHAQISAAADMEQNRSKPTKLTTEPIPWRSIATSKAIFAIIIAQAGFNVTAVILQSYIPTYLKEVMRLDLRMNGILSILPFGVQLILKILYGMLSDSLRRRNVLTSTQAVKIFQSIGSYGCCIVFLALSFFVDCTRFYLVVILLCSYGLVFSAEVCGFYTAILSIAPAYSGLVSSISTTFGLVANACGPILVAFIHKTDDVTEWSTIFFIVAVFNALAGTVFLLFGSEIQEWARPKSRSPNASNARIRPLDVGALKACDNKQYK